MQGHPPPPGAEGTGLTNGRFPYNCRRFCVKGDFGCLQSFTCVCWFLKIPNSKSSTRQSGLLWTSVLCFPSKSCSSSKWETSLGLALTFEGASQLRREPDFQEPQYLAHPRCCKSRTSIEETASQSAGRPFIFYPMNFQRHGKCWGSQLHNTVTHQTEQPFFISTWFYLREYYVRFHYKSLHVQSLSWCV